MFLWVMASFEQFFCLFGIMKALLLFDDVLWTEYVALPVTKTE